MNSATAPTATPAVLVILEREEEKIHSVRYKEAKVANQKPVLGLVYVPNETLKKLGNPARLAFALQAA